MYWIAVLMLGITHACDDAAPAQPAGERRDQTIRIDLEPAAGDGDRQLILSGLQPPQLATVRAAALRSGDWTKLFSVRVSTGAASDVPPVAGRCRVEGDRIVFEPRFSFEPGVSYVVTFDPSAAGITALDGRTRLIRIPTVKLTPSTRVTGVSPSIERLPENLLKFYIHFSAPMSQGDVYRHIRLLDTNGRIVELPFLELDEELWDPSGTRLTVLLDPGRIKRGLKPNEDLGRPLVAGRRYTLLIEHNWPDADGARLVSDFRKPFDVEPPDYRSPDPSRWKLTVPAALSREPLVVRFAEPLDAALVKRLLQVADSEGGLLPGQSALSRHQRHWTFTPEAPWTSADYRLRVGTVIEDLAGNSIARPFEVELQRASPVSRAPRTVEIPFQVQPAVPADGSR